MESHMTILSHLFSAILVALFFAWLVIADQNKPITENLVKSFIKTECSTPEQAGRMAASAVKRLVDMRDAGEISLTEYRERNIILSNGLKVWGAERDLQAYCSAIWKSNE